MGTPRIGKSLDPAFIDVKFRFDQHSEDLRLIKHALCSGQTVVLTPTELTDANEEKSPILLVNFLLVNGADYLREMREVYGEYIVEKPHQNIMELGIQSEGTATITDMITAGCDVYLVPDQATSDIGGRYTLCGRAF